MGARRSPQEEAAPLSRAVNKRKLALSLLAWSLLCAIALAFGPDAPQAPATTPEQEAARARLLSWVERDVRAWKATRGDHRIAWDEAEGHLAIVIDDVGRELHLHDQLQSLRWELTFSILPGSVYAEGAAQRLNRDRRRYREVLLHLPMEPLDATQMSEGAEAREDFLFANERAEVLSAKVDAALAAVPDAVGVNNHMGSKFTSDAAAMDVVMERLGARGLFFLDSRTSAETVGMAAASRAGVPAVSRRVFLDHEPSREAIEAALDEAAEASLSEPVVAIAHPSWEVVEVLRERLPGLHARKIGIYPVSELVRRRGRTGAGEAEGPTTDHTPTLTPSSARK